MLPGKTAMANLLTPDQASRFRPARGYALLKVLPAESQTSSGLHLPETAADMEMKVQPVRKAVVLKVNRMAKMGGYRGIGAGHRKGIWAKGCAPYDDEDSRQVIPGRTVIYLSRQSEIDNDFVVVKIGQIVAVGL
jgi:hypothetical protein